MNIKNNVEIIKLDDLGRGIGYINNKIIFVSNALPNEIVNVEIIKDTNKYYEGNVINYIKKSDNRIYPRCPFYNKCGGCNLMHMTYENSLIYKKNKLENILKKFGDIETEIEVIENERIFNYRNKIELKIENNKWGYYNSKTHDFVEVKSCLLAKDSINDVINNKELFDIKNGYIIIRSNYNNEILISIHTKEEINIRIDYLKTKIKLVGIVVNDKLLYGNSYFIEKCNNLFFKVNYDSFFQINEYITKKMIDILKINVKGENLLDLYCGVGFLSLSISENFKNIYGVEINKNSVIDAIKNSEINKIYNSYFICSDSGNISDRIHNKIDTIIVDPPRTGLFGNTINDILKFNADTLVYVSCNPVTLSRDLKILKEIYKIDKAYLLDMFSNTYHFETIIILKK